MFDLLLADVDDLKDISDLELNVEQSGSVLMFMSRGCISAGIRTVFFCMWSAC